MLETYYEQLVNKDSWQLTMRHVPVVLKYSGKKTKQP